MTTDTYAPVGFPKLQFFDAHGAPLAGGLVTTYLADGVTLTPTYQTPAGTVNTNPVTLDPGGFGSFWGSGDYVFQVDDALGNLIYSGPIATPNAQLGISAAMLPVVQAATTAEAVALLGAEPEGAGGDIPIGGIIPFAGATAPSGFLLCNGQAVSRAIYNALFSQIGTAFGIGDGVTTFNIPDMRSRVPMGLDNYNGLPTGRVTSSNAGISPNALGSAGGSQYLPSHTHAIYDPGHNHLTNAVQGPVTVAGGIAGGGGWYWAPAVNTPITTGITLNSSGIGTSGNVQPSVVLGYIIFVGV